MSGTDTETVFLYDADDQFVAKLQLRKRMPDQSPRRIVHDGKVYIEGGIDSLYEFGEFAELPKES